jgi:hypothetical protein
VTQLQTQSDDSLGVEKQALLVLEAADAQAEVTVRSAIDANDGIDPGPHDLDIGGVGYAKGLAMKIREAGNTAATERLYDAYADRNMTRASGADAFIATLDVVFQRVVDVLKNRTDRDATKVLRQKWSTIARDRAAAGWFVARAPKITMGAPIINPAFWGDLEKRFRDLGKEFGDRLTANWISSAWGEDGQQWCLRSTQAREREIFETLAERAAVGLGHPGGAGALFCWLDRLKNESANFDAGYQGSDGDGNVWKAGLIRKPFEASADQCLRLETRVMAPAVGVPQLPEVEPVSGDQSSPVRSDRPKPADGMRLPASRFHQLFGSYASRPLQQMEHDSGLAAVAGAGGVLRAFGRFLGRAGLLPRLTLLGRDVGATCASVGLFGGFRLRSRSGWGGFGFWCRCHDLFSFRGDRRGHDMDHSGAQQMQADSAETGQGDGSAMDFCGAQLAPDGI